jgi:hypothetical protein
MKPDCMLASSLRFYAAPRRPSFLTIWSKRDQSRFFLEKRRFRNVHEDGSMLYRLCFQHSRITREGLFQLRGTTAMLTFDAADNLIRCLWCATESEAAENQKEGRLA